MMPWEVEELKLRIAEDLYAGYPSEANRKHRQRCQWEVDRWNQWRAARPEAKHEQDVAPTLRGL